ncbi:MAG TPA: diguanylate cyclase [Gammaproteobacteria bacterium]|nr:diguanylate cyclase [Gammaproteobacteria bacterium]
MNRKLQPEDQSIKHAILVEQTKMLLTQSRTSIVMSFLLASFIALVFSRLTQNVLIVAWWVLISLILAAQYTMYVIYTRQHSYRIDYILWYRLVMAAAAIGGLCWGLGLTHMLRVVNEHYHIFLIILLISLAAAGITLAVRTPVYYAFQISALLPVIIWLVASEDTIRVILGFFLIIFMFAMWIFAYQVNRSLTASFRLQLENQSLANSLKQSNARLQVLNEELLQLSATDGLTQVANRRYFDERLISEFSRSSREGASLSLIMIDVDFFKAYNDELGHVAGDECLARIAISIRDSLKRPTDLVARYGGEEFVVLLPVTPPEGACKLAEEIRQNVEALKIAHPRSPIAPHVTVSLGVTGAMQVGKTNKRELLLQKADQALYKAKQGGRNNVKFETYESSGIEAKKN